MRPSLLIYLHNPIDNQVSWAIFERQQLIDSAIHVPLDTVPHRSTSEFAELWVLLPSTEILLIQVDIPSKQRQKIIQAVPYALEDQLAEEIDNLHFALGERDSQTGLITVAVIAQTKLANYIQLLKNHGFTPTMVIPDVLAVPKPSESWSVLSIDELVLVHTQAQLGFAIESTCLNTALTTTSQLPPQLTVLNSTDATPTLTILQGLGIPITEQTHKQGFLAWLVQGTAENKPLNLLQGEYRQNQHLSTSWHHWRLTAVLLLLWGIVLVSIQLVDYQQLKQQQHTLLSQIEQIYRDTFPDARKIVNPRVQMEQQLKLLRTQHNKPTDSFITLLTRVSPLLKQTAGLTIKQMDYREGRFDVDLEVANLQSLEELKQRLSKLGLTVEIQSATSRNAVVESRLRIQKSV